MTGLPVRTAPLSYLQEQLWFVEQDDPGNGSYNELKVLVLDGTLDAARLGRALERVVARHDVLRTTFVYRGTEPVQAIWARGPVLREASVGGEQALMEYAREVAEAPYDLTSGPLLRASLVTLGSERQALVLGVHHIISDGFSMNLLLDELDAAYRGEPHGGTSIEPAGETPAGPPGETLARSQGESSGGPLDERPAQYGDFARWQREQFAGGRLAADVDHWRRALDGAPTVLELPADRPRPRRRDSAGRRERFPLAGDLTDPLGEVAERVGGTLFTVLLAAFAATLYRYTGRGDMVLGTGAPGRPGREFDGALGFFANIVPVRLRPAGEVPFTELADAVSEAAFDAFDHQYVPFEKLVEFLQPERDAGHTPLVQVVFTMWDAGAAECSIGGVPAAEVEVTRGRSRFDVAVEAVRRGDRVDFFVEYDDALFDEATIARLMRHYERVLRAVAADPAQPLSDIPMISPEEWATLTQGDVSVLDPDGNVLPAGAVGQLVRRSGEHGHTGRLAARRPDGRVVERGREDRLVSFGSFQVQLEDVEEVLRAHPAVRDAAVIAVEGGAGRELVAYAVAEQSPGDLRAVLVERLPQYMVPAAIVAVDHIPRGEDGRIRTALLPEAAEIGERAGPPALEAALCVIWARVMNLDEVEPDDDFFALGGHSMLAARLVREIASVLAVRVPLMALFEHCTPADLADYLAARYPALEHTLADASRANRAGQPMMGQTTGGAGRPDPTAGQAGEPEPEQTPDDTDRAEPAGQAVSDGAEPGGCALSTAQLQIWINEQLAGGDARDFIAAVTYRVRGPLEVDALRGALDALVARHENLRARVALVGDVPVLRFDAGVRVELPVEDLTGLPEAGRAAEAARRTARDAERGFDLSAAPLVRATLYRLGDGDHVLALIQHHLVTDGVSMGLLVSELGRLYSDRDTAPATPHLRFSDYVAWEQAWLGGPEAAASERFWRERLREAPELVLPRTRDGRRESRDTEMIAHHLPPADSRRLLALARRSRSTPYMLVTAAFAAMLAQWSGQDDVVIGTTADNRPLPGLEGVVGCFVNMVALRLDCGGDPTFTELAGRVRRTVLEAYAHQSTPFNEVVRALKIHPDPRRMPLFQVTSDWAGDGPAVPELAGCEVGFDYVHTRANRYELEMYAGMAGERVVLDLEYAVELWDREEAEDRLARVAALLTRAVLAPDTRLSALLG
ncbi:condensation domain-containing protein [Streptosporangium sp. NPDC005286]|uniref:condensation domain-containing protein n=1 Tax=Streptosporangium sp. NPDC005286 TaxID=3154463 RepID=UPI0033A5359C